MYNIYYILYFHYIYYIYIKSLKSEHYWKSYSNLIKNQYYKNLRFLRASKISRIFYVFYKRLPVDENMTNRNS